MRHIIKGEKHLDSQNKVSPEQMETASKFCADVFGSHRADQCCRVCREFAKTLADEREKVIEECASVAECIDFQCDHLTCERDWCDDKGNDIAKAIRQLKGKS